MFEKLKGLFSYKQKSIPNVTYNKPGYIINGKTFWVQDISKYFILEFEKEEYNIIEIYSLFALIKLLCPINQITLLIYCTSNSITKQYIIEILKILSIKNFVFIDDYNFLKEDLELVYLNKPILSIPNKILYFSFNNIFQVDLTQDIFKLYLNQYKNMNFKLNLNSLIVYIHNLLPDIEKQIFFNLSTDHIIDTFKVRQIINNYKITSCYVFSSYINEYKNIFPDNTTILNLDNLIKQTSGQLPDLIKLILFILGNQIITNTDYNLIVLADTIRESLQKSKTIYLYNNTTNYNYIENIKQVKSKLEFEFVNDILSKPLNIAFFTRVTRFECLNDIYLNIKNICNKNFVSYKWFLFIPYDKTYNYKLSEDISKDQNIIILDQYSAIYPNDTYDTSLMNLGLMHQECMKCQFVYILDDDNIIHENLINVIRKNIDKYLIINRLQLTEKQKMSVHHLEIECPLELDEYTCVGKVDYANCVFSTNALKAIGGFNLSLGSVYSDGATVKTFIEKNIEIIYSNEIAGYYNYLKEK